MINTSPRSPGNYATVTVRDVTYGRVTFVGVRGRRFDWWCVEPYPGTTYTRGFGRVDPLVNAMLEAIYQQQETHDDT
jgi:hypothetical protein